MMSNGKDSHILPARATIRFFSVAGRLFAGYISSAHGASPIVNDGVR